MNRFLGIAMPLFFAVDAQAAEQSPRPNIVFFLTDDLGPGDVGCYGGKIASTPNIDRMAKEGIRFTQYYVMAPICSPSRCAMITGQYPGRWRINSYLQTKAGNKACDQADFLDPKAPSVARQMQKAGYKTAHFGKWHLGGGRDVVSPPKFAAYGFDESAGTWESPEPFPDITASNWIWSDKDKVKRWQRSAFFVDKTLDFLKGHKDAPCFVNVWLDDPHTPWVPSAAAGKGASTPENLKGVMEDIDKQLGRLLDGIKTLGIDRNTLVIFSSDNGPLPTFKGDRTTGFRGSKLSLYEGGLRLPFIARWPGTIPADRLDKTTVLAGVDLLPTFCKLAGAAEPKDVKLDGEDRSAALLGKPLAARARPLFWEYGRNDKSFEYPRVESDRSPRIAVRDGNWKLLVNPDGSGVELYDLAADSKEAHNVAGEQAEVVARLKKAALDWRKSLP